MTLSSRGRGVAILLASTCKRHSVIDLTLLNGSPMLVGDHVQDSATAAAAPAKGQHVSLGGLPCSARGVPLCWQRCVVSCRQASASGMRPEWAYASTPALRAAMSMATRRSERIASNASTCGRCTKQILDMSRGGSGSKCNGGGVFCCEYSEDPEGQGKVHQWGHIPALLFKLRCQAVDAVQIMLV